jgi:hypothetical protein
MKETYKPYDTEEMVDYYFFRPIASLIVKAVLNTKVTPDHLTFTALFFGVLSGLFFYFTGPAALFSGIFFLLIYTVFDCSDGQLARKKGTSGGIYGRALDGFADYHVFLCIYLCTILKFQQIPFLKIEGAEPYGWAIWAVGLIAMGGHSIQCSCFDYYQNEYVANVIKRRKSEGTTVSGIKKELDDLKNIKGKWFNRLVLCGIFVFTMIQEKVNKKKSPNARQDISEAFSVLYKKRNRFLLRLWSALGSSAHVVYIVIFAAFDRMDLFFFFEAIILNAYMLALMIYQKQVLRDMERNLNRE